MPYQSLKQMRFMHAKHPDIAKRWDKEYGGKVKKKIKLSDIGPDIKYGFDLIKKRIEGYIDRGAKRAMENSPNRQLPKGLRNVTDVLGITTKQKKTKAKIVVNNKMKAYGQMDPQTNKVEINIKKHKGDRNELADSIHHELLHVKHPNMKEKEVKDKATREVNEMSQGEKDKLIAKIRMKKINYKKGAMKRKFKMTKGEKVEPGAFLTKYNESKKQLAIRGLI